MTHTLFAFPFSCAQAPHALLHHYDVPHEIIWVHRGPTRRAVGDGLEAASKKRKVPTLVLPDGRVLTENVAVLTWLDDTCGPDRDAWTRQRALEWNVFVATELHQAILGPLYDPELEPADQTAPAERFLTHTLARLADGLRDTPFLTGETPCGADLYAAWALSLVGFRYRDHLADPALRAFLGRMLELPGLARAREIEGARRQEEARASA